MGTPGFRTISGGGHRSTMAGGTPTRIMAGCGFRAANGLLPGFAGVLEEDTMAGHH